MLFATQLLNELGIAPTEAAIFTVSDTDMSPVLSMSDDALVHLTEQRLSQGNLFLIGISNRVTIRRALSPDGGLSWVLAGERQSVTQIRPTEKTRLRIYGRVRWIGHKL
jgi:hypothetical protein